MAKCLLAILLLLASGQVVLAQEYPRPTVNFEVLIQELVAQQEDDNVDYEDLYETLFQFYQNPINLNQATPDELTSLFLLSPTQINNLLSYTKAQGRLLSIYELQAVPGFDLPTIYKLLPFVTVEEPSLLEDRQALGTRIKNNNNQALLVRYDRVLQQRKGYTPSDTIGTRLTSRYIGSPDKYIMRYRNSRPQDFSLGFTLEKDAGEQFNWHPGTHRYGADFYSAHFQLYRKGKLKALALGDYQLQFGQGLLLSSGLSIGKGSETITTMRRSNLGIRPFTSVLESTFFRGGAFTYMVQPYLEVTGFYSNKRVDAAAGEPDTLENDIDNFLGLQTSGFHRTSTELANKHRVWESIAGSNVTFRSLNRNLTGGLTLVNTRFDQSLQRPLLPYNTFAFTGQQSTVGSLNYNYNWQNISLFGETGYSGKEGWGTVNGLLASLSGKVDIAVIYRNYSRSFNSLYGNAFGESTRNNNERGLYTGIKIKPYPKWELTAYHDAFRFPWLRYRVDAPSGGNEYLLRLLYKPTKTTLLYGQFRNETKGLNFKSPDHKLPQVLPATRQYYQLYLDYTATDLLHLRSRVQLSRFQHGGPTATGYYIGQEINLAFRRTKFAVNYALFDTDDYDTRLYVPERDVLYAFSVPAFSGTGTRMYLLWQQDIFGYLDAWFKIAHTHYRHQQTIGSGLEEIAGPQRTDIRCQVRYRF